MLWLSETIVIFPFVITNVNLDIGPLLVVFLAQETLKQLKRRSNDTHAFGIILGDLVFIHLEGVIPDLDLGLTTRGLPCVLDNCLAAFFCTLAYA